jgi:hypothetical protein
MNADPPPSATQLKMQKNIHAMATCFMQDNMIGLQALPSEEHYQKLQEASPNNIHLLYHGILSITIIGINFGRNPA